jgi:hypothetical protein
MESGVKRGALSSSCEDNANNISDSVSAEDDSDKEHEECVNQDEIKSDGRDIHSCNGPLGSQSVQELERVDQNGCIAAELNFAEGISSSFFFLIGSEMLRMLWTE